MATPASGTISASDLREHIIRGAGQVSLSELRTRYGNGSSGEFSFSMLYKCEGWTAPNAYSVFKGAGSSGWGSAAADPNESNGAIEIVANSFVVYCFNKVISDVTQSNTTFFMSNIPAKARAANGTSMATSYKTTDVSRIVVANTSRAMGTKTSNDTTATINIPSFTMANTGTYHYLVKF